MTIQYQNTQEEYVEASKALARRRKSTRSSPVLRVSAIAVFVVYVLAANALIVSPGLTNLFAGLFHLYFPFVFVGAIVVVSVVFKGLSNTLPGTRWRAVFLLAIFILTLTGLIVTVVLWRSSNPSMGPVWDRAMLVPHVSWMFLMTWLVIMGAVGQRRRRKGLWEGQQTLHRAKSADISAEGVTIADAVTRQEYDWEAFAGWTETKALFILFPSEFQVIFLPKRAFASPEELDAMRALAGLIPSSQAGGFPVVHAVSELPPPLPGAG